MDKNSYTVAGWASIAAAGLMPVAFIVAGVEEAAFDLGVAEHSVGLGASDFLLMIFGAVAVYVLDRAVTLWRAWTRRRKAGRLGPNSEPLLAERAALVAAVEGALRS